MPFVGVIVEMEDGSLKGHDMNIKVSRMGAEEVRPVRTSQTRMAPINSDLMTDD